MTPHAGAGGSAPGTAVREEALVDRLSALAPSLGGDPDPAWQARTRARLVAMAAVRTPDPAPAGPLRRLLSRAEGSRSAWRRRVTAGIAGTAAAVTGLAAVVALAVDAGPGDVLYGVKRGTEQARLALAGDDRGRTLLALATTRLDELAVLLADRPPAGLVEETLATMDAHIIEGTSLVTQRAVETGGSTALDAVRSWSVEQSAALDGLLTRVPEAARAEAATSADLLGSVAERAAALREALDCAGGPATTGTDQLGPVPGACPPGAGAPADGGGPSAPATDAPAGRTRAPSTTPPGGAPGADGPDGAPGAGSGPADPSGSGEDDRPGEGSGSGDGSGTGDGSGDGADPEGGEGSRPGDGSGGEGPTDGAPTPSVPAGSAPEPDRPTPGLPSLPSLVPDPGGSVRPPLGGTAAPAAPSPGEDAVDDLTCGLPTAPDC